jgi:hypothetical protein
LAIAADDTFGGISVLNQNRHDRHADQKNHYADQEKRGLDIPLSRIAA